MSGRGKKASTEEPEEHHGGTAIGRSTGRFAAAPRSGSKGEARTGGNAGGGTGTRGEGNTRKASKSGTKGSTKGGAGKGGSRGGRNR